METTYYEGRLAAALAASKAASHPAARIAHKKMADAYRILADPQPQASPYPPWQRRKVEKHEYEEAITKWENEGGMKSVQQHT